MTSDPLFTINRASFSYGATTALTCLDAELYENTFYGIIGPNGCGKTTFLDLLSGLKAPRQGSVKLRGRHLIDYRKRDLARQLALVPQEYDTGFGYTVEEVVLMGRHPHMDRFTSPGPDDWQAVDTALVNIGISDLRDRYTNTLSGGQKQRVVVARALAQDSPVLLFDEATSSLDIKFTIQIFSLAKELVEKKKRTVIAVIHDLNLAAAYCDQILFMDTGRIACHGRTSEVLTEETIREIFGVKASVSRDTTSHCPRINFHYQERAGAAEG